MYLLSGTVQGVRAKCPNTLFLIVPHRLQFRPGRRATAAGAGKLFGQTRRQPKPGTVGEIDLGELPEQLCLPAGGERLDLHQRLAEEVLEKGQRPAVHPLVNRFGRDLHLALQFWHLGRELGQRRFSGCSRPRR